MTSTATAKVSSSLLGPGSESNLVFASPQPERLFNGSSAYACAYASVSRNNEPVKFGRGTRYIALDTATDIDTSSHSNSSSLQELDTNETRFESEAKPEIKSRMETRQPDIEDSSSRSDTGNAAEGTPITRQATEQRLDTFIDHPSHTPFLSASPASSSFTSPPLTLRPWPFRLLGFIWATISYYSRCMIEFIRNVRASLSRFAKSKWKSRNDGDIHTRKYSHLNPYLENKKDMEKMFRRRKQEQKEKERSMSSYMAKAALTSTSPSLKKHAHKYSKLYNQNSTTPIPHLPDEIWFHIFSHLHGTQGPSTHCKSSTIVEILQPLFYLSKGIQGSLIRYAGQVPQGFSYNELDLEGLAWAMKYRMKLSSLDLSKTSNTHLKASASLHLLHRCKIEQMHTFRMDMRWFRDRGSHHLKQIMVQEGIPLDFICDGNSSKRLAHDERHATSSTPPMKRGERKEAKKAEKHLIPKSDYQQKQIVDYVTQNAKQMKNLDIIMYKARYYTPIFHNFSQTLETLEITLMPGGHRKPLFMPGIPPGTYANELDTLTKAIEDMPKLEKLTINSYVGGELTIRSKSLEIIDTSRCGLARFWVPKCICPSLKMFISKYGVENYKKSGIQPVRKFTSMELIDKWNCPNRTSGIEFPVSQFPFVGLEAPDSCVVRLYTV